MIRIEESNMSFEFREEAINKKLLDHTQIWKTKI